MPPPLPPTEPSSNRRVPTPPNRTIVQQEGFPPPLPSTKPLSNMRADISNMTHIQVIPFSDTDKGFPRATYTTIRASTSYRYPIRIFQAVVYNSTLRSHPIPEAEYPSTP
ncbi:hypothetical protein TNCT_272131 [Trichonephila clavata]|uniref:Uncharacterized protein n=1 Tax=Trichonephila clavata TaxID=2740835 RepID=A0A8X6FDZ5_TRICU|nr:hypothetical protein TNCT_272131 [Trichonephila clavata]